MSENLNNGNDRKPNYNIKKYKSQKESNKHVEQKINCAKKKLQNNSNSQNYKNVKQSNKKSDKSSNADVAGKNHSATPFYVEVLTKSQNTSKAKQNSTPASKKQ